MERKINNYQENNQRSDQVRLAVLEQQLGVDLSASKLIDPRHCDYVRKFGNHVIDWVAEKQIKPEDRIRESHEGVNNTLVLTAFNKRDLLIAQTDIAMQDLKGVWESLSPTISAEDLAFSQEYYQGIMDSHIRNLNRYNGPDLPLGTKLAYLNQDGELVESIVLTDWSDKDVYSEHPLEAAIAEEALHLTAELHNVEQGSSHLGLMIDLEEIAIEWYVLNVLKALKVDQGIIDKSSAINPDCKAFWEEVQSLIGSESADALFFEGTITNDTWAKVWRKFTSEYGIGEELPE